MLSRNRWDDVYWLSADGYAILRPGGALYI